MPLIWAWLRQHQAKLQFGLRMTLAALASYGLGEALGLAQAYWAVLSSVIVTQGSVGGSLKAGINRMIGTVGGAVWGAIVSFLIPHGDAREMSAALFAATAPLAIVTGFRADYRVAPITAIIVLTGSAAFQTDPVSSAISRVFEISLGSAVAIAVAFFILPARAHRLLARSASASVSSMADMASLLESAPGPGVSAEALFKLQNRIRAQITQTEARAEEARVERANHLSQGPDPEPVARNLRRLRHDFAMLARALSQPFSQPVRERVEEPLKILFAALAIWLRAVSEALTKAEAPPSLEPVCAAAEGYKRAVAGSGQEALTYQTDTNDTQRVFALLFLFEQLLQNLQDLADRTAELSRNKALSHEKPGD
jgi:uncharacterized membrane protein YccC